MEQIQVGGKYAQWPYTGSCDYPHPVPNRTTTAGYVFGLLSIREGGLICTLASCAVLSTVPAPMEEAACLWRWLERNRTPQS